MGSFSLPEGLFYRAAKHHLHGRHCHAYIFERRSQNCTLLAICSDTPAQLKSDECIRVVSPFEQSFYRRLLNSGDPLQWKCLNKDLVVVLSSLHTNRNKLKGGEDFNWNNICLASLWFLCDFSGTHDFGWWFLADLLSGHVSTTILMQKCDSNIGKFVSTELRAEKYNKSVFASGCFKTSCLPFRTVRRDNVDFGRICGGRERDSETTAHVGRITKMVGYIRIVFGLPYNYKLNLSLKMI